MLTATQQAAQKIKAQLGVRTAQTAAQKLQAASFLVASYVLANNGRLPPTTSPEAFRAALSPSYLTDVSVLTDGATGKPFTPNPVVSGMPRKAVAGAYLLASDADAAGYRTVLFVSGTVRTVGSGEWATLTAPQTTRIAPVAPLKPAPSPAVSPR